MNTKIKIILSREKQPKELMVSIRLGEPDNRVSELHSFVPLRIGNGAGMKLDKQNIFNYEGIYDE